MNTAIALGNRIDSMRAERTAALTEANPLFARMVSFGTAVMPNVPSEYVTPLQRASWAADHVVKIARDWNGEEGAEALEHDLMWALAIA